MYVYWYCSRNCLNEIIKKKNMRQYIFNINSIKSNRKILCGIQFMILMDYFLPFFFLSLKVEEVLFVVVVVKLIFINRLNSNFLSSKQFMMFYYNFFFVLPSKQIVYWHCGYIGNF